MLAAAPSEPGPEDGGAPAVSGRDDGTYVSAASRSNDGVAAARASCTGHSGQSSSSSRGRAAGVDDVHMPAVGWAQAKRRPRTRMTAVPTFAAGVGARATALELMIQTETKRVPAAGDKLMADDNAATTKHDDLMDDEVEAMDVNIRSGGEPSAAAGSASAFFPGNAFVTDALRATLAGLGASNMERVHEKVMLRSDRLRGQNRLLISCKRTMAAHGDGEKFPFAGVLTETERPLVHRPEPEETATQQGDKENGGADGSGKSKRKADGNGKGKSKTKKKAGGEKHKGKNKRKGGGNEGKGNHEDEHEGEERGSNKVMGGNDQQQQQEEEKTTKKKKTKEKGLSVAAYDRDGRRYVLQLKYLSCNNAYRIIGPEWAKFLRKNGLLITDKHLEQDAEAVPVRRRKRRRKRSPDEAWGEGTSSSPDEEPNGGEHEHPKKDADDVHIEVWAFRSPELALKENAGLSPGHPRGALGLLLLHRRDGEDRRAGGTGAAPEELPEQEAAAAPDESTEKDRRHGAARQDEDMMGGHEDVAPGCAGGDAQVEGAAAGEPDDTAPRSSRDPSLTPLEWFIAFFLASLKGKCTCTYCASKVHQSGL